MLTRARGEIWRQDKKTRCPMGKGNDDGSLDREGALVKVTDGLVKDDPTVCVEHNGVKEGNFFPGWEN